MAARRARPVRRRVTLVLGIVLALSWFVWLRPTSLGGRASYVVVQGHSMDPTYHDGDLVIVREEDHYAKGDIIAFRAGGDFDDPTRVIHRIVGSAGHGRFTTQGDNRPTTDPWTPGPKDIIGRAVFHVPRVGAIAFDAGRPQVLAALGGAAVFAGERRRRKRKRMSLPKQFPSAWDDPPRAPRPRVEAHTPPRWLRQRS